MKGLFSERGVLGLALVLSALRLAMAPVFELFPQEAYYDLYAQHLALSYFDHPPLVAWALRGFETVFGHHAFVLRLCAFCLTAITQVLFVRWVGELIPGDTPEAQARRPAALLWLLLPAVSVVSLIATPDVPLLLFWTATLLALTRALRKGGRAWVWVGLWMGLAFDGKYTAAYLPVGVALLLSRPEHRHHWRTPWLWAGAGLALIATAPVLLWNAQHGFASLAFQTVGRASSAHGLQPRFFAGLLGSQTALIGPAGLLGLGWIGLATLRRRLALSDAQRFCAVFALPPFLGFFLLSLFIQVKPNWLEPFYVTGLPLLALAWPKPRQLARLTLGWSLLVHLAGVIELGFAPVEIVSDDTFIGWSALAEAVKPLWSDDVFVFSADGYKTSAELWFYSGRRVYAGDLVGLPGLQFAYLDDPCPSQRDAIFLDSDLHDLSRAKATAVPAPLVSNFGSVEQLEPLLLSAHGRVARKFYVWKLKGYRRDVAACR